MIERGSKGSKIRLPLLFLGYCSAVAISISTLVGCASRREVPQPPGSTPDIGWPVYGRDPGGSRYAPIDDIGRDNVANLRVAWTYRTGEAAFATSRETSLEATPLVVDGTMYLATRGSAREHT